MCYNCYSFTQIPLWVFQHNLCIAKEHHDAGILMQSPVTSKAPVERAQESLGNVRITRPLYTVEMLAKCPQPIVVSGITSETSTSTM